MNYLEKALNRAFIDKSITSEKLNPKFIVNNPLKKDYFLTTLQNDLTNCESFFISVAFITQDGLNAIKTQLADLALRGISGKILTSTYLGFNNPHAFKSLLQIPNVEVRISGKEGFHSKGYLFDMKDHQSFIIGSSNLTMSALKINYEWNVKLTSDENGEMISTIQNHLLKEWDEAQPLTHSWLSKYTEIYEKGLSYQLTSRLVAEELRKENTDYITPNSMQKMALDNLRVLREEENAKRGLIVSATGTGKTYLAAFDVARFKPDRLLFVAHREQILNSALESFKKIIGGDDAEYGILSGNRKDLDAKYLFSTVQTLAKDEYQQLLGKDAFDYILIDEVHKAGAKSYVKIIDYFEPDFLLGMTATPERTDGFNIFKLFDYNIAYEIRLQEALEEDMLCPFHYFCVTDYEKDGQVIDETSDLKYLTDHERVDFLMKKINYYGCSGDKPNGLVFCSRKEEAEKMAILFNERGLKSTYLSGEHSIESREYEINRLESGDLSYIFTVDIFNEGIDIPKVNQIIMLRNTQSSIIFIQQLGRGLRKDSSKDFVTVIDFVGNYKNNYMIPMALSGDNSRSKTNLRRDTIDSTYITGLSSVNFEKVAKERVFHSIDKAKLDTMAQFRESYHSLKNRLNRIPYLIDFEKFGGVDPLLLVKKDTYYNFLQKMTDTEGSLSNIENQALKFVSIELMSGIRAHELIVLEHFLSSSIEKLTKNEMEELFKENSLSYSNYLTDTCMNVLDLSFYHTQLAARYADGQLFKREGDNLVATEHFKGFKQNLYFIKLMKDAIDTGLVKSKQFDKKNELTLYKKYRRKDALRALNMKFNQNEQGIGGYTFSNNHFVIFVTLNKGKDFGASQIDYEDEFLDHTTFQWFTKSSRTMESPEVKVLRNSDEWHIHLFIKRNYTKKDKETDFYYLGEMNPIKESIHQKMVENKKGELLNIVQMNYHLNTPIEPNMYEFLTAVID